MMHFRRQLSLFLQHMATYRLTLRTRARTARRLAAANNSWQDTGQNHILDTVSRAKAKDASGSHRRASNAGVTAK